MTLKDLPYKSEFASIEIKPMIAKEKDELLALASLQQLSAFIPNIDPDKHIDLLPIAFNACVVNRVNKNGDIIDTDTALAVYKNFVNKFIDTEHNRQKVIGVILTSSLSEFGTDRPLTEDEVRGSNKPFNITLGGILWKAVNEDLCDLVEESNDPTSENYMNVSASWELGFSDYRVIELAAGEKNLINPIEVTNPEEKASLKKYLKSSGGSGVKDGKSFYRMPYENVIPMGIGLTEKPAADVVGIAAKVQQDDKNQQSEATQAADNKKNEENFSHSNENNVKIERINNMKITSIKDITDDNLKQCTASAVAEFIASEIQKASEEFAKANAEKENLHHKLQSQHDELHKTVADMKHTIETMKQEKDDREKMDAFHHRMGEIHAKFNLPSNVAKHVADEVKCCADAEAWAKYMEKADALLHHFKKGEANESCAKVKSEAKAETKTEVEAKAETKEEIKAEAKTEDKKEEKPEDKKEAKAEEETEAKKDKEAVASAVEEILDNAKVEKAGLPNSSSAGEKSLKSKYQQAFAEENFVIKL